MAGTAIDGAIDSANGTTGISTESAGATNSNTRKSDPTILRSNDIPEFDPADFARTAGDGYTGPSVEPGGPRKRGRPPGSKNGTRIAPAPAAKETKNTLAGLEAILLNVHQMAAAFTGAAECMLDEKEAKELTIAMSKVAEFYPTTVEPKTMAWINLAMVCGGIYGTRIWAYRVRMSKEKPTDKPGPVAVPKKAQTNGVPLPPFVPCESGGVDHEY